MTHARRAVRTRPSTPVQRQGSRAVVHVQTACTGCGRLLGNVLDEEIERAIAGLPPLSTVIEHGCSWRPPETT